ncbi:MAG: hypothetical protein LH614_13315 [Pyrinomonadaceae bacterium]|nr:hypothetical protein [Pyrinomonadaceae bacterium]
MNIDWLQFITTILTSGLISAFLTGFWLNGRTEKIKAQLQEKLYEFQTKFSWFHQKQADTIAEIYSLLSKYEQSLKELVKFKKHRNRLCKDEENYQARIIEYERRCRENDINLSDAFNEKEIFFTDANIKLINETIKKMQSCLASFSFSDLGKSGNYEFINPETNEQISADAIFEISNKLLFIEIPKAKQTLKDEFHNILSTENSNKLRGK